MPDSTLVFLGHILEQEGNILRGPAPHPVLLVPASEGREAFASAARDYWRAELATGDRLWLYYAHGGAVSGGWFCQGVFA